LIISANELAGEFHKLRTETTFRKTYSSGYQDLDELFKLAKGYLGVVTGYPGSGKSEWLDAVLVNASIMHGWKTLYFSPENYPVQEHIAKLAEKIVGKWVKQFTETECKEVLARINDSFSWINIEDDLPSPKQILEKAKRKMEIGGLDCLVIDPWNGCSHARGREQREDEYLAEILTEISYFARRQNILVNIVAHPKSAMKDKTGKMPRCTVSDISGGAMWWNKVDYAFIAHRPDRTKNQIEIEAAKVKLKWMGQIGSVHLDYERKTGRFKCLSDKEYSIPVYHDCPF